MNGADGRQINDGELTKELDHCRRRMTQNHEAKSAHRDNRRETLAKFFFELIVESRLERAWHVRCFIGGWGLVTLRRSHE
jgi:hypothetical protein